MKIQNLKDAKFLEAFELLDGKYRTPHVIGIFTIGDKDKWFEFIDDELSLTDLAINELKDRGLHFDENLGFDFLTQKDIDKKIEKLKNTVESYQEKLDVLENINETEKAIFTLTYV